MNRIQIYFALLFFGFSCTKRLSFEELIEYESPDTNFNLHSSSEMNYAILLPDELKLTEKSCMDTLCMEMFMDTSIPFEKGTNTLSILKFNSKNRNLEQAWNELRFERDCLEGFSIYSKGYTNVLTDVSAYYEHSGHVINEISFETVCFLFHDGVSSLYFISAQVNVEKNYPDNLKELIFFTKSISHIKS